MRFGVVVFPERGVIAFPLCNFGSLDQPVQYVGTRARAGAVRMRRPAGGFSYGDYLGRRHRGPVAGRRGPGDFVASVARAGSCNGFQILCEAACCQASLTRNECLRIAASHHLVWERGDGRSRRACDRSVLTMPSRTARQVLPDPVRFARLKQQNLVVFRYAAATEHHEGQQFRTAHRHIAASNAEAQCSA